MNVWHIAWIAVSIMTTVGQLVLGTAPLFALISLAIFLLTPHVFLAYQRIGNIGGFVFAATFAKLFLVAQWVKIFLLQPADSNLQAPEQTALVLLLGLAAFWIAALILTPLVRGRQGLVRVPQDPDFMRRLALLAMACTLYSVATRHYLGLNRVGESDYVEGQGLVIVLYLGQLMPLAVAALTARAAILSNGRNFVDWWVVAALALTVVQGLWENQRMIMLAGLVAYGATYLSYGGRVRAWHLGAGLILGIAMQLIIFPLVDLQRNFSRELSPLEYLAQTFKITGNLADPDARSDFQDSLEDMYLNWDTRLYYGDPLGFLDRFAPNPLDETIQYVDTFTPFGLNLIGADILYGIPNAILLPIGIIRSPRAGEVLEISILGTFTNMNYGIFAQVYAAVGAVWFMPLCALILVVYLGALHAIFGGIWRNYLAGFAFSVLYFTFAVSDLAEIVPQLTIQGPIYLGLFFGLYLLAGRRRSALRD